MAPLLIDTRKTLGAGCCPGHFRKLDLSALEEWKVEAMDGHGRHGLWNRLYLPSPLA